TEKQGMPRGTETPYFFRISLPWYSWIFTSVPPSRLGFLLRVRNRPGRAGATAGNEGRARPRDSGSHAHGERPARAPHGCASARGTLTVRPGAFSGVVARRTRLAAGSRDRR